MTTVTSEEQTMRLTARDPIRSVEGKQTRRPSPHHTKEQAMQTRRILAVLGFLALGGVSCGNLAESALETAVEQAAEAAAENGEDVEFDLDLSSGSAEVSVDGSSAAMGVDLDRPDWLDDDFALPDGLSIHVSVLDEEVGQSIVGGETGELSPEEVISQQSEALEHIGFSVTDQLAQRAHALRAIADDGRIAEVEASPISDLTAYRITFYEADTNAATHAVLNENRVEGTGTATVAIGDVSFTVTGTCTAGDDYAQFGTETSDSVPTQVVDGSVSVIDAARITVSDFSDPSAPQSWLADQASGSGSLTEDGFEFSGSFVSIFDNSTADGTVSMRCDG